LEDKTYVPTGGDESKPLKTNFKLIVATNKDVIKLVMKNLFRRELFYRVNMNSTTIIIPSLNSRRNDIEDFIDYYIQILNIELGWNIKLVDLEVVRKLKSANWDDGNIRTLFGVIRKLHSSAVAGSRESIER